MTRFPKWATALLALAVSCFLAGGAWFYISQKEHVRREVETDLKSITERKAGEIALWRAERLADASVAAENPFLADEFPRWLSGRPAEDIDKTIVWFRSLRQHYRYHDVLLVDRQGGILLSLSGRRSPLHPEAVESLAAALRERRAVFTDLYAGPDDLLPHADAIAPILSGNGEPIGAVVLQTEARQFLYPLIKLWPTTSRSAETLLVRRDGDSVLYLNELRHQPDTALKLRIPLDRTEVPAVRVVLGERGVVYGKDYRGIDVVSVLTPVTDTPWLMVAKMDVAEAFAAWRFRSILILAIISVLLAALVAGVLMLWHWRGKEYYRALCAAEAARRESEERYQITLTSIGDAVIAADSQGRVNLMNPVAESLTGWRQDEARGRLLDEVFHIINEETRQPVENPVHRVLREGLVIGLANHTVLITRDGKELAIADSGAPVRSEDGNLMGIVLVFREQTAERAAQKALRKSEERLRQFFDYEPGYCYVVSPDGVIMDVNRSALAALGFAKNELVGKPVSMIYDPESQARIKTWLEIGRSNERIENEELVITTKGGERRWVLLSATAVRTEEGRIGHSVSVQHDITDRKRSEEEIRRLLEQSDRDRLALLSILEDEKRAEEALRESEGKIRSIVNNIGIGVALISPDMRILELNRRMREWFPNVDAGERPICYRVLNNPPRDGVCEYCPTSNTLADGEVHEAVTQTPQEGRVRNFRIVSSPIRNARGEVTAAIEMVDDITERLDLEARLRQAQKLESIGTLAGGVAHEINNPINGIMNYAQLILDRLGPDSPVAGFVTDIGKEAERVAAVVKNLLSFSRFEKRSYSLARMCDIAEATLSLILTVVRHDQIKVEVDVPEDLPKIKCRSQQIQQVLMNLLTNARDALNEKYSGYHEDKIISITARTINKEGRPWVRTTVEDHGSGIPPNLRERIFDPFFTTKPRDKGSGLGLSISHGIIKEHGGELSLECVEGELTRFHFDLPVPYGEEVGGSESRNPEHGTEA